MSRQFWEETLAWATSNGTAVANTTTETILFPNVTIPANYLQDGRCLRVTAILMYGTTGTPTIQFKMRWGGVSGTVICASGAITTTSGVGSGASMLAMVTLEVLIQVRSNGAAGTLMSNGQVITYTDTPLTAGTVTNYGQPSAIASGSTGGDTPVAVAADLTVDTALSLTVVWGTANSANSIQGLNYTIEAMN